MYSACYPLVMDTHHDDPTSRDPLAIGRHLLRAKTIFDGTKLPVVVGLPQNRYIWYRIAFSPLLHH